MTNIAYEYEKALREIFMLCGGPDPSDGDGTSANQVVEMVKSKINALESDRRDRDILLAAMREIASKRSNPDPWGAFADCQCIADKAIAAINPRVDQVTDTQRLDWLERQNSHRLMLGNVHLLVPIDHKMNECSVRQIIDAAMKEGT